MSISFKNPFFQEHYDSSILAIVNKVSRADSPMDRHGAVGELADAVETAALIFSFAEEDLIALRSLQTRLVEQVSSRRVTLAQVAEPEVMRAFKPLGIIRVGMNCWANAILQMLVNAPTIAGKILEQRTNTAQKLAPIIRRYYEAQIGEEDLASGIDGQVLRQFSEQLDISREVMEDPVVAVEGILDGLEFKYNFYQDFLCPDGSIQRSPTLRQEQMLQLDLMSGNRTFKDLIEGFFMSKVDDGRLLRLKLRQPPEDLLIHACRFGQVGEKMVKIADDITQVPSYFDIDPKYVERSDARVHYELTGAIIHVGEGLDGGHYVAVVKKPDKWYLIDDADVTPITSNDAQQYLKQGYLFHYRTVERPAGTEDFEIIDVNGTVPSMGWTVAKTVSRAVTGILYAIVATVPLFSIFSYSK